MGGSRRRLPRDGPHPAPARGRQNAVAARSFALPSPSSKKVSLPRWRIPLPPTRPRRAGGTLSCGEEVGETYPLGGRGPAALDADYIPVEDDASAEIPLGPVRLGGDELNLAEFPFTLLSDRRPPGLSTLEFTDTIRGPGSEPVTRVWTVTGADEFGLPLAGDEEIYVALMEVTREQEFQSRTLHVTRYDLIHRLGWPDKGGSYKRLHAGLDRLLGVTITAQKAFYDRRKERFVDLGFHIIDDYLALRRAAGPQEPRRARLYPPQLRLVEPGHFRVHAQRQYKAVGRGLLLLAAQRALAAPVPLPRQEAAGRQAGFPHRPAQVGVREAGDEPDLLPQPPQAGVGAGARGTAAQRLSDRGGVRAAGEGSRGAG